jgi:hypothetical protein
LIVNGDQVSEEDKGDYFPWWLNDLVTAIFDPVPMLDSLRKDYRDFENKKSLGDS